jgi:alkane 1-monooxygenase/p-cymene monooxygenase
MFEYLKYFLPPLTQVISLWGFYMGGDYVWIAIAWFPLCTLLDSLLPIDLSVRQMAHRGLAYLPVWLSVLLGPCMYAGLAWASAHHDLTGWQLFGAVLGTGWMSMMPWAPAAHELYHARGKLSRFVARYSQVCYLDPTRLEAHVVGHHIEVSTETDSDTARRGETLFGFTGRAVIRSTLLSWRVLSDALEKRGYGRWSIRHALWRAILAQIIFQSIIFAIGGWMAVALALTAMVLSRAWLETFNYFQHYGQVRVPGSPIERRHVWNHFGYLSRLLAFDITVHADHHTNSYQPYYALTPHVESIRMPSVFTCFVLALIPPLWFKWVMKPALKEWDLRFASEAERRLASAANRRAGWDDWVSSTDALNRPSPSGT